MNTIVVYTSMTGTTEMMAQTIANELAKVGNHVVVKDAVETYADDLKSFELILIGSYTWGDGELADEIVDFYNELLNSDLTGKVAATFGPGESTYEHFARAVDILEEALSKRGCLIITKGLKVDRWLEDEDEIEKSCKSFAGKLTKLARMVSIT